MDLFQDLKRIKDVLFIFFKFLFNNLDRDFSIIIPETSQLLFLSEEEDFDQDENFDSKLFKKYKIFMFYKKKFLF